MSLARLNDVVPDFAASDSETPFALQALAAQASTSLDPVDWTAFRTQAHQMLDDMIGHLQHTADEPLWREPSPAARTALRAEVPEAPTALAEVYDQFRTNILPYGSGNIHPGFMAWVQGGGTPTGMLAEMLAGGMNVNAGGRDHMAIEVERQITAWVRDLFGFPETAGGLFLTGASQANFVATVIARTRRRGSDVRRTGLAGARPLTAYTSVEAHGCIPRALDMCGVGTDHLRRIDVDGDGRIRLDALKTAIAADRAAGFEPFLVVGSAGTVNTGAIDDLTALAALARAEDLHFHVDGALGALGVMAADLKPLLRGIELCDSLAFDFHKWGQVPYDAGFLLVRDEAWQRQTFASDAAYLTRAGRGLAGGDWWPCDTGPDLSRGFRALKTWFTLKTHGTEALGRSMSANCRLARRLAERVDADPRLVRLAPVALNVVCFARTAATPEATDRLNSRIVEQLHMDGRAAPSLTLIHGRKAIRAAIVNHRTTEADIDALLNGVLNYPAED